MKSHMSWVGALAGVVIVLLVSPVAVADPIIEVGTYDINPASGQQIVIPVSGGDDVVGLNFLIQLGDGGTANGGVTSEVVIQAVDLITDPTLIFEPNNAGQTPLVVEPQLQYHTTITAAGTVSASGNLAVVTIDASAATPGQSFDLRLRDVGGQFFGTPTDPLPVNTDFAGVTTLVSNGQINIVPEPASLLLSAVGLLFGVVWYGRRRRKS